MIPINVKPQPNAAMNYPPNARKGMNDLQTEMQNTERMM